MLFGTRDRHVKRILIVEDEPLVAFDNEMTVGNAGYTVVGTVDSVREALAVLAREMAETGEGERGIDLILSDLQLSGERSGTDLAREAKALGVPVLYATANAPETPDGNALGVLLKPYNERRLRAALKAVEQRLAKKRDVKVPDGLVLYDPSPTS